MQTGRKSSTSKNPKVSLVCVTFNAAENLPVLLQSISANKTPDTEVVIIDGGSTDGTLNIIKNNEAIIDFWLSEPDNGIYDAMNKAINYAKGNWIVFLGADDVITSEFSDMVNYLQDDHTIYYGDVLFYGKEFRKVYDDYYLTKLNICHQGIFYPKAVFEKYQYDTKYRVYADYHLNLRCWHDPEFAFEHRSHLVASFNEGGFSTTTKDEVFECERDQLFKRYLTRKSYYRYLNRTIGWFKTAIRFILNR